MQKYNVLKIWAYELLREILVTNKCTIDLAHIVKYSQCNDRIVLFRKKGNKFGKNSILYHFVAIFREIQSTT